MNKNDEENQTNEEFFKSFEEEQRRAGEEKFVHARANNLDDDYINDDVLDEDSEIDKIEEKNRKRSDIINDNVYDEFLEEDIDNINFEENDSLNIEKIEDELINYRDISPLIPKTDVNTKVLDTKEIGIKAFKKLINNKKNFKNELDKENDFYVIISNEIIKAIEGDKNDLFKIIKYKNENLDVADLNKISINMALRTSVNEIITRNNDVLNTKNMSAAIKVLKNVKKQLTAEVPPIVDFTVNNSIKKLIKARKKIILRRTHSKIKKVFNTLTGVLKPHKILKTKWKNKEGLFGIFKSRKEKNKKLLTEIFGKSSQKSRNERKRSLPKSPRK